MHCRAEEGLNEIAILGLPSSHSVRYRYFCASVICSNPNGAALRETVPGAAALRAAVPGAAALRAAVPDAAALRAAVPDAVNAFDRELRTLGTLSERGWYLAEPRRYSQQQQDQS